MYGVCIVRRERWELSLTWRTNHLSAGGSSFLLWSSNVIEYRMWLYCFCNFGNQVFPGLHAVASDLWPPARNQFALEGDAPELQEYPQAILKKMLTVPYRTARKWPWPLTFNINRISTEEHWLLCSPPYISLHILSIRTQSALEHLRAADD